MDALLRSSLASPAAALAAFALASSSFADIVPVPETGGVMIVERFGDACGYPVFFRWTSSGEATKSAEAARWEFSLDASATKDEGLPLVNVKALGLLLPFLEDQGGGFSANPMIPAQLERIDDGCNLKLRSGERLFFGPDGRLKTIRALDGRTASFSCDPQGRVVSWSVKSDKVSEVSFDDKLSLDSSSSSSADSGSVAWGPAGLPSSLSCNGRGYKFVYEGPRLKAVSAPNGKERMDYVYDASGRVSAVNWPNGSVTEIGYDAQGRLSSIADKGASSIRGVRVDYGGTPQARVVNVWDKDKGVHSKYLFTDSETLVESGPLYGAVETRTKTDLTTGWKAVEYADGSKVEYLPSSDGLVREVSWAPGRPPELTVSKPGEASITSAVSGEELRREMVAFGGDYADAALSGLFRSVGLVKGEDGRVLRMMAGKEPVVAFKYNSSGRLSVLSVPGGGDTKLSYDQRGRIVKVEGAEGQRMAVSYDDKEGSATKSLPGGGEFKVWSSKESGRTVKTLEGGLREIAYGYDSQGNLSSLELKGFDKQRFFWPQSANDARSLFESQVFGTWCFLADQPRLQRRLGPAGSVVRYTLDEKRRVVKVWGEDPAKPFAIYSYDAAGRPESSEASGSGRRFSYDQYGRLASDVFSPAGVSLSFAYAPDGTLSSVKDSAGGSLSYAVNAAKKPVVVKSSSAGVFKIAYGPYGLPSSVIRPNGVETRWEYDGSGRVLECRHLSGGAVLLRWRYAYDEAGNVVSLDGPDGKVQASYDRLSQLSSFAAKGGPACKVSFDPWGNLLAKGQLKVEFSKPGHPSKLGDEPVKCDAAGRLVSIGSGEQAWSFSYDFDSHLKEAVCGKSSYRWTYGPAGELASYVSPEGATTRYLFAAGALYASKADGASGLRRFVMLPGSPLCLAVVNEDGQAAYPLWDASGTAVASCDSNGKLSAARRSYDLLGQPAGEDRLGLPFGWLGALSFADGRIVVIGERAYFTPLSRLISLPAPQFGAFPLTVSNPLSMFRGNPCDALNLHLLPEGGSL